MKTDLIIVKEYCQACHIDPAFLSLLENEGLIKVNNIEGEDYLSLSQLYDIERYTRMYYDLSINIEGIDAIQHLLERIKQLQKEVDILKNKLKLYETDFGI